MSEDPEFVKSYLACHQIILHKPRQHNCGLARRAARGFARAQAINAMVWRTQPIVAERTEYARPLLDQLKIFLDTSLKRISGKSGLAEAIRYPLARWKALSRYLSDGRHEMTNNAANAECACPCWAGKITCSVFRCRRQACRPHLLDKT